MDKKIIVSLGVMLVSVPVAVIDTPTRSESVTEMFANLRAAARDGYLKIINDRGEKMDLLAWVSADSDWSKTDWTKRG
jgi:hypothetical protein